MAELAEDYGTYTIITSPHSRCPIGIRAYHIPYPERVVGFLPGYKRSSQEQKFRYLAEELAARGIASVGFDLYLQDRHDAELSDLVYDMLSAEEWVAHELGWEVSSFATHSLGAYLLMERLSYLQRMLHRHERPHLDNIVFLAPATNQTELIRYWFFRNHEPTASWHDYQRAWNEYWDDKLWHEFHTLPAYSRSCLSSDLSYQAAHLSVNLTHIHGLKDTVVPLGSVDRHFSVSACVNDDHDLENPQTLFQWVPWAIETLVRRSGGKR